MKAWLFQDTRQKLIRGDNCPWSVGWYDPDGRKRSKTIGTKSNAEKFRRRIEGQLAAGTYENTTRKRWADFRVEYEEKKLAGSSFSNREAFKYAANHFERLVSPGLLATIKASTIDDFIAKRRVEKGKRGGALSLASLNRELRYLRAALKTAERWGYLARVPEIKLLRVPRDEPRFVSTQHFAAIYEATDVAKMPSGQAYPASEWWKALAVFAYMTGWRIGELLTLQWSEVDLDVGEAVLLARNTKGRRGGTIPLHPLVVEHLKPIRNFDRYVFPWPHDRGTLWVEFSRIQRTAKIDLPCRANGQEGHKCTPRCHVYGFHDFRRAFATENAGILSASELQRLMRHASFSTTRLYVSMADRLRPAVDRIHVPQLPRKAK